MIVHILYAARNFYVCILHIIIKIKNYFFLKLKLDLKLKKSIGHGCSYKVKVLEEKPARSPLTQGGLEVKCSVTASWTNEKGITLLKKLVDEKYSK